MNFEYTTSFFAIGLKCMQNGVCTDNISISLKYLLSVISQDKTISVYELFELKLLERIIPLIQSNGIDGVRKYLGILYQFTAHGVREEQADKYLEEKAEATRRKGRAVCEKISMRSL